MEVIKTTENFKNQKQTDNYGLYSELKDLVETYKGGISSLSHKISVSKPTLWRWTKHKNSRNPNPHNVLALLKFITKESDLYEVVKKSPPHLSAFLKKSFKGDFERNTQINVNSELNELFEDFYCYLIHRVTNTEKPMTRKEIKKTVGIYSLNQLGLSIEDDNLTDDFLIQLGYIAEVKINKLITSGVLQEQDGFVKSVIKNPNISIDITKKHLPKLFHFFKQYNMAKSSNMLYGYQESITKEAINKILKIQYKAFMDCYKIMEDEKSKDGEIYLLTVFFDSLNV